MAVDDITYNVYYALDPNGPWTKHNPTPLADNPDGNSYTLTGLTNGVLYYIMVVGGFEVDGEWTPRAGQAIGPTSSSAIGITNMNVCAARPVAVTTGDIASQDFEFELTSV